MRPMKVEAVEELSGCLKLNQAGDVINGTTWIMI
jgi:hypothetical protein